jgi:hypothetical protein
MPRIFDNIDRQLLSTLEQEEVKSQVCNYLPHTEADTLLLTRVSLNHSWRNRFRL